MKRGSPWLAGCLLLTLSTAAGAQTFEPELLKQLVRDNRDSVVLLRGQSDHGGTATGTGFFLQDGRVITNWHVVSGMRNLRAVLTDGSELKIQRIMAADREHDLALLDLRRDGNVDSNPDPTSDLTLPIGLALAAPPLAEQGEPILVIGSPEGLGGSVSTGIVAAQRPLADLDDGFGNTSRTSVAPDAVLLQITAGISPGSSGSPVLDRNGAVIGVVVSQYLSSQNLNFAIPVREVHKLLARPLEEPVLRFDDAETPRLHSATLRNLLISVFFFGLLWLTYRRLR